MNRAVGRIIGRIGAVQMPGQTHVWVRKHQQAFWDASECPNCGAGLIRLMPDDNWKSCLCCTWELERKNNGHIVVWDENGEVRA